MSLLPRVQLFAIVILLSSLLVSQVHARRNLRTAFFDVYPSAVGTRLDNLPSNSGHCGLCHFDFDGGGARTPYGEDLKLAIDSGAFPTVEAAIQSLDGDDSDSDGFTNSQEITDTVNFANTPTFPGYTAGNVGGVSNVNPAELTGFLTPDPPVPTDERTWGQIKALYKF